jgi:hypothetical protein
MGDFWKSLQGKKTYIGAVAFVALALYQFYSGQPQSGFQSLVAAWTAMGLRMAMVSPQSPPPLPLPQRSQPQRPQLQPQPQPLS